MRAPLRLPLREIDRFVRQNTEWILRTQARMGVLRDREAAERRALAEAQSAGGKAPDGWSWLLTEEELSLLKAKAVPLFAERAALYAPRIGSRGVTYGRITVRCQKTRWGSCSAKGNLNFNLLLLLAPSEVLDYVVVHELCHLLHMDHSAAFWREVARVLPDFRQREKWLKTNGRHLMKRAGH